MDEKHLVIILSCTLSLCSGLKQNLKPAPQSQYLFNQLKKSCIEYVYDSEIQELELNAAYSGSMIILVSPLDVCLGRGVISRFNYRAEPSYLCTLGALASIFF